MPPVNGHLPTGWSTVRLRDGRGLSPGRTAASPSAGGWSREGLCSLVGSAHLTWNAWWQRRDRSGRCPPGSPGRPSRRRPPRPLFRLSPGASVHSGLRRGLPIRVLLAPFLQGKAFSALSSHHGRVTPLFPATGLPAEPGGAGGRRALEKLQAPYPAQAQRRRKPGTHGEGRTCGPVSGRKEDTQRSPLCSFQSGGRVKDPSWGGSVTQNPPHAGAGETPAADARDAERGLRQGGASGKSPLTAQRQPARVGGRAAVQRPHLLPGPPLRARHS